jgi:hypothetical protein
VGDLDNNGSVELLTGSLYWPTEIASNGGEVTLWSITSNVIAHRRYRGAACLGSNGHYPRIELRTSPRLGRTVPVRLRGALPNTTAVLAIGGSGSQPLAGTNCTTHASALLISQPILTDAMGVGRLSLPIPLLPALAGLRLAAYWHAADLSANPLGMTTSNACELVLGQ